ncbi:hypothetical protein ABS71_01510 [bacterium SCN 62-11]|nr:hypothetical protein [Candidatus Eremiobacteraeota bacterium]ODT78814.1 MAG: hypothetical protein ABS71_01510 [bacterium SCN 62-11]
MITLEQAFDQARQKLESGQLAAHDLDQLYQLARGGRQRLLYLYALQPTVRAGLVASTIQDSQAGSLCQIDPLAQELPYQCVMDAVADGWRVIHFPDHRAPYQEGRMDMLGYEFILEKYGA